MDDRTAGWMNGFAGVAIFSGSLPATRLAVHDLDPLFLTTARAAIAGLVSMALLLMLRQKWPARPHLLPLAVVALCVVVGFPLLTAIALQNVTAARATIFIGLLPLSTAVFGVLRGGDRPRPGFWLFSLAGAALVAFYALGRNGSGNFVGDALMAAAIVVCGLGYAEGARLSRELGGWQVICLALVLALPVMLPLTLVWRPAGLAGIGWPSLAGLAYVSLFSMLIGFVFWYRGLAKGGIAAVGQLQLLQPFLSLALSALLLGEQVGLAVWGVAACVVLCVAGARRLA
ncbi:DMT family transporter [Labrys monachus]|uniref:Drug/metabolite transporter (DMT)-like permease n=1 Tax=Labrys monachus TaxID=217067 RepID=A0ABU0F9F0_9HYPH|nr:DMT family transporter [Labrys monachus]MDQ0391240.1 drug/metabolite transporter (DMT)-like permease [Labrys monachus]